MTKTSVVLLGLLWLANTAPNHAQAVSKGSSVTATATIQAIDTTARRITLRSDKGEEDTYTVGPEVARFNEFKVGDKVKMTYYESIVYQVRKPGDTANVAEDAAAFNRARSARPAGTIATQEKRTVSVKTVDPAGPSITVTTEDGRTVTRKIENKKNLEGVKPGDRIDITYTQALITSVEPAK
jgi:Cu/Ag efflux protein CusF